MNVDDLNGLRRQIAESFARRVPGKERAVIESPESDIECRIVRASFEGKRWQDVDASMVAEFKDALPLFTPDGFARFLPAYMLGCLDQPELVDTALDSVLFNLTPPNRRQVWEWNDFEARARLFGSAEARSIFAFLERQAAIEEQAWAAEGRTPLEDRFCPAIFFWRRLAREESALE